MKTIILMLVIMMTMSMFQVPSIQEWLVSQLRTGDLISADPRIISYTEWNNWDNYFSKLYVHMYKIVLLVLEEINVSTLGKLVVWISGV